MEIFDNQGNKLGQIPITGAEVDHAELDRRLQHMLQTDRATLRRLSQALDHYIEDSGNVMDRYGVTTNSRRELPELQGGGISFALNGATCNGGQSFNSGESLTTASGEPVAVTLNHIAYRPDVTNYEDHRIYASGDLENQLFSNQTLVQAMTLRHENNLAGIAQHVPRITPGRSETTRSPCHQGRAYADNHNARLQGKGGTTTPSSVSTVGRAYGVEL